jgi:hypothetical protein
MVTPSGCTTETCTGAGGADSETEAWATGYYASNSTGATNATNGKANTAAIVALASTTPAALWCSGMNYGGYNDWYLPSYEELNYVLYNNNATLGGFHPSNYWSSTEYDAGNAWAQDFNSGSGGPQYSDTKTFSIYVRCVRSY